MNKIKLFVLHCLWEMSAHCKLFFCKDVGAAFNFPFEFSFEELEVAMRALLKGRILCEKKCFNDEERAFAERNGRRCRGLSQKEAESGRIVSFQTGAYIYQEWMM
jgi:hypothetical protein